MAGRPSALLVAVAPRAWRTWDDVAELFSGPADDDWGHDRDQIDGEARDPWAAT